MPGGLDVGGAPLTQNPSGRAQELPSDFVPDITDQEGVSFKDALAAVKKKCKEEKGYKPPLLGRCEKAVEARFNKLDLDPKAKPCEIGSGGTTRGPDNGDCGYKSKLIDNSQGTRNLNVVPNPDPPPVKEVDPPPVKEVDPPPVKEVDPPPVKEVDPPPVKEVDPPPVKEVDPPPVKKADPPPVKKADPPPVKKEKPPKEKPPEVKKEKTTRDEG